MIRNTLKKIGLTNEFEYFLMKSLSTFLSFNYLIFLYFHLIFCHLIFFNKVT